MLSPDSVFGAGGGRSSVEAWYTTALDIEEVFSGVVGSDINLFVADVIISFDTVDPGILDKVLAHEAASADVEMMAHEATYPESRD